MAKPNLTAHVAKAVRQAPTQEIASALGALVLARLARRQRTTQRTAKMTSEELAEVRAFRAKLIQESQQRSTSRRSARRIGRNKYYTPTSKVDVSRLGTFRHYMIMTIRQYTCTREAEQAHSTCDNPKFNKNRLDFNWAADNGFINWN